MGRLTQDSFTIINLWIPDPRIPQTFWKGISPRIHIPTMLCCMTPHAGRKPRYSPVISQIFNDLHGILASLGLRRSPQRALFREAFLMEASMNSPLGSLLQDARGEIGNPSFLETMGTAGNSDLLGTRGMANNRNRSPRCPLV